MENFIEREVSVVEKRLPIRFNNLLLSGTRYSFRGTCLDFDMSVIGHDFGVCTLFLEDPVKSGRLEGLLPSGCQ